VLRPCSGGRLVGRGRGASVTAGADQGASLVRQPPAWRSPREPRLTGCRRQYLV